MKHAEFVIPDQFINEKLAVKINNYEDVVSFLLCCATEGLNTNTELTLPWAAAALKENECVYLRYDTNLFEAAPRVTGCIQRGTGRRAIIDLDDLRTGTIDATDILDLL